MAVASAKNHQKTQAKVDGEFKINSINLFVLVSRVPCGRISMNNRGQHMGFVLNSLVIITVTRPGSSINDN